MVTGYPLTDQLAAAGEIGPLTVLPASTLPTGVSVSSSGLITSDGTTPVGVYSLSGIMYDAYGDTGTWSYTLQVLSAPVATITQTSPTNLISLAGSSLTFQLATTGQMRPETFYVTSTLPTGVSVSSSGLLSSVGTFLPGSSFQVQGDATDTSGDVGTWNVSVTYTADGVTITQSSPTTTTFAAGQASSIQLITTGQLGTETFTATSTLPPGVSVSSSGLITSDGTTPAGIYTLSGTDTDTYGGTGTWSLTLTVDLYQVQTAPFSGSALGGVQFADQINLESGSALFTFTATSPLPTGVSVSSSGLITSDGTTPIGVYQISGVDWYGADLSSAPWYYTLTVTTNPAPVGQSAPTTATVPAWQVSDIQLTVPGQSGNVTFNATSPLPPGVEVWPWGLVMTTTATPSGVYTVSGTDANAFGGTGTWSLTITAAILQSAPTSAIVVTGSPSPVQLVTVGQAGTETFTATSSLPPGVTVSASGLVASDGTTPLGVYTLSGTDADTSGGTGTWSLTLTVESLGQSAPTSATFLEGYPASVQLATTSSSGPVTFTTTSTLPPGIAVSSTGLVTVNSTALLGTFTLAGTDADTGGDTGVWSFTLTMTAIVQDNPLSATTPFGSPSSTQLTTTGDLAPAISFTATSTLPTGVTVYSSGLVTSNVTTPPGVYTISGTDTDELDDYGTWTFTLTVTPVVITQSAPTTVTLHAGQTSSTQLVTTGQVGPETFTATSTLPPGVTVSASGLVASDGTTPVGVYTLSGTTADSLGDTGVWTLTLTMAADGVTIVQSNPVAGGVTAGFPSATQLVTTGQAGAETFTVTSTLPPGVTVSASGLVTSNGTTPPGVYSLSGTISNTAGSTGTWTYTLKVSTPADLVVILGSPRTASTDLSAGVIAQLNRAVDRAITQHRTAFVVRWRTGTYGVATARAYAQRLADVIGRRVRILTHRAVKVPLRHVSGRGTSYEMIAAVPR